MFFWMLVGTSDWQTLVLVQSLAKMAPYVDLYLNRNEFLINLFYSCENMVTKGDIGVNSSMLLIFSQVRSSVAVGTPDYISPEILQVCTPTTLGLQCSGWEYFKKQPCPSWNACWIAPNWKKLQNLYIYIYYFL